MKAVTEFQSFTLNKALGARNALKTEGKTPEEIEQKMGESFKLEGEKLKHFMHAMDVAEQNAEKLMRVMVVSLAEGENPPAKAVKVDEHYYMPVFLVTAAPAASSDRKGGHRGGKGGGRGGKGGKESPWGQSPEELAAKKSAKQNAQ